MFKATFNNISVISWLKLEDPEKTTNLSQVTDKHHIMLYTSPWSRFKLTTSVVTGTDCIYGCKSNYHKITATMAPDQYTISFSLKLPHKMELNFTWMTILRRSSTKIPHFILIGQKSCMVAIGNSGFWLTNIKKLPYICQWKCRSWLGTGTHMWRG